LHNNLGACLFENRFSLAYYCHPCLREMISAINGEVALAEDDNDLEKKINDWKHRAEKLSGGHIAMGGVDDCGLEIQESFWKHLVEYEEAPSTTHFQQLEDAGMALPPPDSLSDLELTTKLWELIHKLALLRVFIEQTDHLSDRELYTYLRADSLREETKALTLSADSSYHIQILGGCSDEDNWLFLKYYADEEWRQYWRNDFPNDPMPDHEDPPYARDRFLPKADYSSPASKQSN
jgi:hypothetical protein